MRSKSQVGGGRLRSGAVSPVLGSRYAYGVRHLARSVVRFINWPLRIEPSGTSLKQAQQLLAAAEDYLTLESGQFLTPLTHAEVLSYISGEEHAADGKVSKIVTLLEERRDNGKADNIQLALLPRAYLLRGNIVRMRGDRLSPELCAELDHCPIVGNRGQWAGVNCVADKSERESVIQSVPDSSTAGDFEQ